MRRYAVLKGIEAGNIFWTGLKENDTPESLSQLQDGTVAYKVLGIYDSAREAQTAYISKLLGN